MLVEDKMFEQIMYFTSIVSWLEKKFEANFQCESNVLKFNGNILN